MQLIGSRFVQTPRFLVETQHMCHAISSRRTKYQRGIILLDLFRARNVFLWQTKCIALTHRNPHITVTAFIAQQIKYCNPKITIKALIVR